MGKGSGGCADRQPVLVGDGYDEATLVNNYFDNVGDVPEENLQDEETTLKEMTAANLLGSLGYPTDDAWTALTVIITDAINEQYQSPSPQAQNYLDRENYYRYCIEIVRDASPAIWQNTTVPQICNAIAVDPFDELRTGGRLIASWGTGESKITDPIGKILRTRWRTHAETLAGVHIRSLIGKPSHKRNEMMKAQLYRALGEGKMLGKRDWSHGLTRICGDCGKTLICSDTGSSSYSHQGCSKSKH